jgi:hypothetical protein
MNANIGILIILGVQTRLLFYWQTHIWYCR